MGTPITCNESTAYAYCSRLGGGPWPYDYNPRFIDVHIADIVDPGTIPADLLALLVTPFTLVAGGSSQPRRYSATIVAPGNIDPHPTYNVYAVCNFETTHTRLQFLWGPALIWHAYLADPCQLVLPQSDWAPYDTVVTGGVATLSICPGSLE